MSVQWPDERWLSGRMLTTQLVFSRLLDVNRARGRDIATRLGLRLDGARSVLGATEGIPDDGHDCGDATAACLFVEQYRVGWEMRRPCGVTVR